ncbi:hypothetical protein N7468_004476 [Penicillium chermesinum]|uniref:Nitronate monooxygenase domain-containing protein n=1 Tax=Penicillium chermesinum TaxID=63820 RepID=A0A9W9TST3_9EURO|nr:uncharacterized protein N7468_004476 [Penicillium chermesinum]KAJ5239857.1 hypothetical protein N7468_004476 [Penicillium chermesinum]KAJ6166736.1 hypothetical protein N7470_002183 [Penicillium chermesinum]
MASPQKISTTATEILGIKHPVLLAGMNMVASPRLAAAVTNAGGLGVIGGGSYTPEQLRDSIRELKTFLHDKNAPFGVDLLIPKVGGGARKTNYDYLKGQLDNLVGIMIEEKVKIFVCAVGTPPKHVVDRLHANGILYMNMCGHPKHAKRAAELGADLVCAQGGEGGGHTGDVPTVVLIPAVYEAIQGHISPLTGKQVQLIAGGGIYNGRSLAAALMLGASAVWVGTRFILSEESGASPHLKEAVRTAGHGEIIRSTIFSGRPINSRATPYLRRWEEERRNEMLDLQSRGIVPVQHDLETKPDDDEVLEYSMPLLMGKVAAVVETTLPAKKIIDDMVDQAAMLVGNGSKLLVKPSVAKL